MSVILYVLHIKRTGIKVDMGTLEGYLIPNIIHQREGVFQGQITHTRKEDPSLFVKSIGNGTQLCSAIAIHTNC